MKVIYHPRYCQVYTSDPAAAPGRMESICNHISPYFETVEPQPAAIDDISLIHSEPHIEDIRHQGLTYDLALLAAGGAISAAESAFQGEPAFGLIRPPGHHASRDHCWGFCFFNNMAISVAKLRKEKKVHRVVIVDIDLHYGDGTANIFRDEPEVSYFHAEGKNRQKYIDSLAEFLGHQQADIIAVSTGFDRHEDDWGGLLKTEDYHTIGKLVKEFAEKVCHGRRYGVLEGGYNHQVLGKNVKAFLDGMA